MFIHTKYLFLSILFILSHQRLSVTQNSVPDTPFTQEYHIAYPIKKNSPANNVRTIVIDMDDQVWAGTDAGLFLLNPVKSEWEEMFSEKDTGPVFDLTVDNTGVVWIAAWNGIYFAKKNLVKKIPDIDYPVAVICAQNENITAMGPQGIWQSKNSWRSEQLLCSKSLRALQVDSTGGLWVATGMGLYHQNRSELSLFQKEDFIITPDLYDLDYAPDGSIWVAGLGGISVIKNNLQIDKFTPADGLPTVYVQCVKRAPNGIIWIGTKLGISRYDGKNWSLRHSRRWLLDDNVRDIAFDSYGNAWIATENGVSAIKHKKINMAQKAAYFHKVLNSRHTRDPFLIEKCLLLAPGDTNNWQPLDNDNDGQYTGMYLAMESYRYAVAKAPEAKTNAKKAFEALKFLQTVTNTEGFVARTVIPVEWKQMFDPNRSYSEQEKAKMLVDNPREKIVEKRWHPSRDGKWLWKGDTSSDEITGHMYGYLFYYDLVANPQEKNEVCSHVCKIVDYIIENGYVLKDIDGKHTKWGVWSPDKLNKDPDWRTEQNINSLELLSYIKLAYHLSGLKKYETEYLRLLFEYNYIENIQRPKTTNPSWRTHIDEELLALAFPCLMMYENNPKIRTVLKEGFEQWFNEAKKDRAPFFNFLYGAFSGMDPNLQASLSFLKNTPLDLVRWHVDNTKREDIRLTHMPEMENLQTNPLLPIDEISFFRWDNNPWLAIQGDGGVTESDGVFWLLPYWMGRYYGFIKN
jgi:hypothetical protein